MYIRHYLAFVSLPLIAGADSISFNDQVRPILSDTCFACHGPDLKGNEGDLRLDTFEGAVESGAIVPGKPEESELMKRVLSHDPDDYMPPPKSKLPRVTDEQVETLRQWIKEGAKYEKHWAFLPIGEVPVPEVKSEFARNPIDHFVEAGLSKKELSLRPEADRRRLIRRVSFDLTGLPPTPEEVEAFVEDQSADAYEKVVDRLLSSSRYGEHMAVGWLDLARYADTYGMQQDKDRAVWRYRDWVIKAFNENLPYDEFLTWQVAGDLLPNATDEQILATAFNRLHQQKVEGGSVPEEFRIEYVADRTQTFGTAFLGLTLECSRCHDHKFDPISQKEYFQLTAFFQNIDEAGLYSFFTPSIPTPTLLLADEAKKNEIADIEQKIAEAEKAISKPGGWTQDEGIVEGVEIASFDFDDGSFANRVDAGKPAKGGNNSIVDSRSGKVVRLTGDDAVSLSVGDFARWDPFSISLWMNTPDEKERAVVFHRSRAWTDAGSRGYELLIVDGKLQWSLIHFWPGNAISIRTKDVIPLNEWTHVAVGYDGSSRADGLSMFINGEPADIEVVKDKLTKQIRGGGGKNIAIGERFRDRGFKGGMVDEFRVFNRSLDRLKETDPVTLENLEKLRALREQRSKIVDGIAEMMVMRELPEPKQAYLLERGAYDARGESVDMETPAFLPPFPKDSPRNRLGLAQWLTQPDHPLTSRTAVNRFWARAFGQGLVTTEEDFGSQAAKPDYPKLLDWLSADFMKHGWDVKRLMRTIVTSQTYRQESFGEPDQMRDDPDNLLLSRGPRHRLSAEIIRDNALAASGLLVEKIGGPSVRPYEISEAFKDTKVGKGEELYRRSLYTRWKISAPAPAMVAFDAAKRTVCSASRERTTSPLQALILMNGPQFTEAARVLGEKLHKEEQGDIELMVKRAFVILLGREPDPRELEICRQLHGEQLEVFRKQPKEAEAFLSVGEKPRDPSLPAPEIAAAGTLMVALMNHDECVTKR